MYGIKRTNTMNLFNQNILLSDLLTIPIKTDLIVLIPSKMFYCYCCDIGVLRVNIIRK